jgi:hypothetical protein
MEEAQAEKASLRVKAVEYPGQISGFVIPKSGAFGASRMPEKPLLTRI